MAAPEPSLTSSDENVSTPDVLTVVQDLSLDALPLNQHVHPFSATQEASIASLRRFIDTTGQITQSLTTHLPLPFSDTKLLSLFRQYTTISHNVHMVRLCVLLSD